MRSTATATRRSGCTACSTRNLGRSGAYIAGDYSIADIACFPWIMTHKAQGFTLDDYPNVKRWYADVRARPQVQAGLAIGKFVKEPFDEEARATCSANARRSWWGKGKSRRVVIASQRVARSARDDRLRRAILRATRGKIVAALLPMTRIHKSQSTKETP